MKIELVNNIKSNISEYEVRWYLSSQEIWIGKEENYDEIEDTIGRSYGSFKWLFSEADTVLFDKINLQLTTSIIKVNEPIEVSEKNICDINIRVGVIKLIEANNFSCELGGETIYYSGSDTLVSGMKAFRMDKGISAFKINKDFSFLVDKSELVGLVLENASSHIVRDEINFIDRQVQSTEFSKEIVVKYLKLIECLNNDLTGREEEKLKRDFEELYEKIGEYNTESMLAIKKNICEILDFM